MRVYFVHQSRRGGATFFSTSLEASSAFLPDTGGSSLGSDSFYGMETAKTLMKNPHTFCRFLMQDQPITLGCLPTTHMSAITSTNSEELGPPRFSTCWVFGNSNAFIGRIIIIIHSYTSRSFNQFFKLINY